MMKNQNFGIEIEMTGITRETAANAIAKFFGTTAHYVGGGYSAYEVADTEGKKWKIMSDASIYTERKVGKGKYEPAGDKAYSVEVVSPILTRNP